MPEHREEFVTLGEAQERLGVSRFKITQLVKEGKLTVYRSELDRREKLVQVSELESLTQPRSEEAPGKIAA
jgi:excisionase family DNA binding protein